MANRRREQRDERHAKAAEDAAMLVIGITSAAHSAAR
jgi:hypothetical protein